MQMNRFIVGPVQIEIGSQKFNTDLYVDPIFDEMVLGFDCLKGHGIDLSMSEGHMKISGETVQMTLGEVNKPPQVTNVSVTNRTVVPLTLSLGWRASWNRN